MSEAFDAHQREKLQADIHLLLVAAPAGLSEYELLQALRENGHDYLATPSGDMPALYAVHFILFHTLYHLSDQLYASRAGSLHISPLQIQLRPYQAGEAALQQADPLRSYYLDLEQARGIDDDAVYKLLAGFWHALGRHDRRAESLTVLGLQDPVSDDHIQHTYRRLVMQHHPDRGGDKERLQSLNLAIANLIK